MTELVARLKGMLLAGVLLAAAGWYLARNPPVGRAVAGVVATCLAAVLVVRVMRARGSRRSQRTLGDLLCLTPPEFEQEVARILAGPGCRRVRVVGRSADLGIDIICFDRRGLPVVVQCKRHAPGIAVGSGDVQRFLGSITHSGAGGGILVTTSRFTEPARELASHNGIELIDGESLVAMVRRGRRREPPEDLR